MLGSSLQAGAPVDWIAPELLVCGNTLYQPSASSDIYALATVVYEVSASSPTPLRSLTPARYLWERVRSQAMGGRSLLVRLSSTTSDLRGRWILRD